MQNRTYWQSLFQDIGEKIQCLIRFSDLKRLVFKLENKKRSSIL